MNSKMCIQKVSGGAFSCHVDWRNQHGHSLPKDLLEEAAGRLGGVCLVYAVTYFLACFGSSMTQFPPDQWVSLFFLDGRFQLAWGAILLAIGLYIMTKRTRMAPEKLLDLGLVFLIVGAVGISSINFWGIYAEGLPADLVQHGYTGIPWESVWILIFPVMVPNCPKKTLMAALLAASTGPVTTSISLWAGATSPEISHWFFWRYFLFTNYLCALLAWFTASYIHKLGSNLTQARDVGSYTLGNKLGEGGMGEVYRAEHRLLARPAAIKLIRPQLLGSDEQSRSDALTRFKREAQATASLHSPHTIRLFDFGNTSAGSFYYVMELLQGISLDRLVQKYGPQPPERVVPILMQIAHSLEDAHRAGVIHRDIKPSNLFLCRMGQDDDFMKVLDFGLVKATRPGAGNEGSPEESLTQVGITAGTPTYLSPEMALSRPGIDARSDLYSLGCVAIWLLTGEPLFLGESPLATVAMHLKDDPIPPSQRSEFSIPPELEAVIMDCLAKEPKDRPSSAAELSQRLAECPLENEWDQTAARRWWEINDPLTAEAQPV
jgi:eukaryotic-like serine/threonine-protein kinase